MPARQATTQVQEIKLAHSPDSDDAFMFYALATNRVKAPGLKFTHVLSDIETLNQAADREVYDVTAISCSIVAQASAKATGPSWCPAIR
jgi:1,4-dihydroxy-6-naphthoate synthase